MKGVDEDVKQQTDSVWIKGLRFECQKKGEWYLCQKMIKLKFKGTVN